MTARAAITSATVAILFAALPVFAQLDPSITNSSLTIGVNPAHPTPGQTVQLTAESPLLDLADSAIEWTVNGASAGSGQSIQIALGKIGSATNVAVSVSGGNGSASAQLTLVPTSIDLLWESDSYTPAFYEGRALPTPGSSIRVMAIPHFTRPDGTNVAAANIIYTWKNNGAVIQSASGIGNSSLVVPAAILFGSDAITLDARTQDGTLSGEASVTVRTEDPQLVLYENNPLFGIMFHQALAAQSAASESETSFVAVPYFADAASPRDQNVNYAWSVNGAPIKSDTQNPNEVTVSAQYAQTAQINLTLSDPSDPFVSANGGWNISFPSGGGSVTGSAAPTDAFHQTSQ
jgi:hypothetical protein